MAADERVAVKTYVPQFQKERWADHADELDMSQSEFVRSMVQAGRRKFDVPSTTEAKRVEEPTSGHSGSTENRGGVGGNGFEDRILGVLSPEDALDWDELVSALVGDVETELEDTLETLQSSNRVRSSGKEGGYVLVES